MDELILKDELSLFSLLGQNTIQMGSFGCGSKKERIRQVWKIKLSHLSFHCLLIFCFFLIRCHVEFVFECFNEEITLTNLPLTHVQRSPHGSSPPNPNPAAKKD